ncbi:hypothetical protein [Anaerovirgula multivorans]|uniref:hypothetical protein n=1 Tax=Anaerovirgula multivorans TaxID=312168 RepID=UPI000B79306D|nr:hypothetical protein [Anaerovirgula multivorans]
MANLEGGSFNKFIIFKCEDADKYLPLHDKIDLVHIQRQINEGKAVQGKKDNTYLIINTDEPYADEVIDIMKKHGHWG